MSAPRKRTLGVALVEALVALAVMSFGMLALAGVQSTLRRNADTAKQRAEAVRIGQLELERWRGYAAVTGIGSTYASLGTGTNAPVTASNAVFTLTRSVDLPADSTYKTLRVDVGWVDRSNETQNVRLTSVIHAVPPEFASTVSVAGVRRTLSGGRHPNIPVGAVPLGSGSSGFRPPQTAAGTVVWVFNNVTGVLVTCSIVDLSQVLSTSNITGCGTQRAQLLAGYVNFSNSATQATATEALAPTGTAFAAQVKVMRTAPSALTVDDSNGCFTTDPVIGQPYLAYYCAVPVSPDLVLAPLWSGYSIVTASSLPLAPAVNDLQTCRYTSQRNDNSLPNAEHPRAYVNVDGPLASQNFLVVLTVSNTASDCPSGAPLPSGYTTYPQPQTPPI